jgi:hypothetical protein
MAKPIGLGRHVTFSACQGKSGSVGEIHSLGNGAVEPRLPIAELAVRVVARELTSHKGTYVAHPSHSKRGAGGGPFALPHVAARRMEALVRAVLRT